MDAPVKFTKEKLITEIMDLLEKANIATSNKKVPCSYPIGIIYNSIDLDKMSARLGYNEKDNQVYLILDNGLSKFDEAKFQFISDKLNEFGFDFIGYTGMYDSNVYYKEVTEELKKKYSKESVTFLFCRR